MATQTIKESLHIYYASVDSDNTQNRKFTPLGPVKRKNHEGGYFTHGFVLSGPVSDNTAGAAVFGGPGTMSFRVKSDDSIDDIDACAQMNLVCALSKPIIWVWRTWVQVGEKYVNKQAVSSVGTLMPGSGGDGSIAMLVEGTCRTTVTDTSGTVRYYLDCMTGAKGEGRAEIRGISHLAPPPIEPGDVSSTLEWEAPIPPG